MDEYTRRTFFTFTLAALPLWIILGYLYLRMGRAGLKTERLLIKFSATFLSAASALFALRTNGIDNFWAHPEFWFFLLCAIADVVLEIRFLPGMALFAAGHVCLTAWLLRLTRAWWWSSTGRLPFAPVWLAAAVWVAAMAAAIVLFRKALPKMGGMILPACLYVGVLSAMLAVSAAEVLASGKYWYLLLGALCFFISDLLVAKNQFGQSGGKGYETVIMVLYWGALYLLSAFVWQASSAGARGCDDLTTFYRYDRIWFWKRGNSYAIV